MPGNLVGKTSSISVGAVLDTRTYCELRTELDAANRRVAELESAIKKVVTQEGDDICWRDIYTDLAKLVGIEFCPKLIAEPEQMLANCCEFVRSLRGGDYTPVYVERNKA